MSWTSPASAVAGTVLTAAWLNTYLRDNENALRSGGLAIASQAANDFVYASSATQLARLAAVGSTVPYFDGSSWGTKPLGIQNYAASLSNVISTASITTFLSATIVNAIAVGDVIEIWIDSLLKQNTGGPQTGTLTVSLGGQTVAGSLGVWNDSATEYEPIWRLTLIRVGANVKVLSGTGGIFSAFSLQDVPWAAPFSGATDQTQTNSAQITAPTLSAGQSLLLRFTPGASSSAYYLKPQAAMVTHFRN